MGTLARVLETLPNKLGFHARISSSAPILKPKSENVKRPASPFALFYQENSKSLKLKNPEVNQKEIMKIASDLWKNSASYEQQRYRDLFDTKMIEFKQSVKVPPKRPATAYIRFYVDNNASLSVIYPNVVDRSRKSAEMWNTLSSYEKSQYKMQYERELKEFQENLTEEDKEAIQNKREASNLRKEKQNIRKYGKEAWKERPKLTQANPYREYIREQTPNIPKGENSFAYLSKTWKQLSETEREKYKEIAIRNAEQSRKDLSDWEGKNKTTV